MLEQQAYCGNRSPLTAVWRMNTRDEIIQAAVEDRSGKDGTFVMTAPVLTIEVYSDVVCPWCYVGRRRFEQALESTGRQDSALVFWPRSTESDHAEASVDRRIRLKPVRRSGEAGDSGSQCAGAQAVRMPGSSSPSTRIARTPNTFVSPSADRFVPSNRSSGRRDGRTLSWILTTG